MVPVPSTKDPPRNPRLVIQTLTDADPRPRPRRGHLLALLAPSSFLVACGTAAAMEESRRCSNCWKHHKIDSPV